MQLEDQIQAVRVVGELAAHLEKRAVLGRREVEIGREAAIPRRGDQPVSFVDMLRIDQEIDIAAPPRCDVIEGERS